jgi:hypothetical protein
MTMSKQKFSEFKADPVTTKDLAPGEPETLQKVVVSNGKRSWTVGLESLPDMAIEAESQGEAVKAYNTIMGIIATEHTYRVS